MRGSYEELPAQMREQVDALLDNALAGPLYKLSEYEERWLREHVSNVVLTCLSLANSQPASQKKGAKRGRASGQS